MPGIETTSTLSNYMPQVLTAIYLQRSHKSVMHNLVDIQRLAKRSGTAYRRPKLNRMTAYQLTEGVDMAQAQSLSTAITTVTPVEHGVQLVVTDLSSEMVADGGFLRKVGEQAGTAIAVRQDIDLLTLLDGFSNSIGSGSSTSLDTDHISAAFAIITGNSTERAAAPFYTVVHPYSYEDMNQSLAVTGTYPVPTGISQEVLSNYWVSKIENTQVFIDGNLTVASSAAKGGTFSKEALILVEFGRPSNRRERDESLRGEEWNFVEVWGEGEYQDAFGAELNVAASTPS